MTTGIALAAGNIFGLSGLHQAIGLSAQSA
jgi:hypothetical protein